MEKPTIKISDNLEPGKKNLTNINISDNLKDTLNKNIESYSDEWLKSQTYTQRDSGDKYKISEIYNNITGKKMLKLINIENNIQITKESVDFINILKNSGGAWTEDK